MLVKNKYNSIAKPFEISKEKFEALGVNKRLFEIISEKDAPELLIQDISDVKAPSAPPVKPEGLKRPQSGNKLKK